MTAKLENKSFMSLQNVSVEEVDLRGYESFPSWEIIDPRFIIGPANDEGTVFWAHRTGKTRTQYYLKHVGCDSSLKGRAERDSTDYNVIAHIHQMCLTSEFVCPVTGALIVRDSVQKSMLRFSGGSPRGRKRQRLLYQKQDDVSFDCGLYHPNPQVRKFVADTIRSNLCAHTTLAVVKDTDWRIYFSPAYYCRKDEEPMPVVKVIYSNSGDVHDVQFEPKIEGAITNIAVSPNAKWISVINFPQRLETTSRELNVFAEPRVTLYADIDGIYTQMYCSRDHYTGCVGPQWFTRDSSHFLFIAENQLVRICLS